MNDIREIVNNLGRSDLSEALRCGPTAIVNAISRGLFPAAWYPTVQRLAREKGIAVPDNLFNWRNPEDAKSHDAVTGDASARTVDFENGRNLKHA